MKTLALFIITLVSLNTAAAQDSTYTVEDFNIKFTNGLMTVSDSVQQTVYTRQFDNPKAFLLDLDQDGLPEFLVNDAAKQDGATYYTLYVFNTVASFYMNDSLYSGMLEPYSIYPDEYDNVVLVTGSPDYDSLYTPGSGIVFSPLVCWSVTDSSLSIINDKLYDTFINENEKIVSYIDSVFKTDKPECESTELVKQALAALYANFYSASESVLAEQALKRYYKCGNAEKFRDTLKNLL